MLAGVPRRQARAEALRALRRIGLGALGRRKLSSMLEAERRAVLIVQASLGPPPVMAIQTPLAGLDEASQRYVADVVTRAANASRLLVSSAHAEPGSVEHSLLARQQEVLVLESGIMTTRGPPSVLSSSLRRYLVVVSRRGAELAQRLAEAGLTVGVEPREAPPAEEPSRLVVQFEGEVRTDVILDAALAAESPIVELVPLGDDRR
jgi:ABC-type multidrug transport system ATPase subunit